MEICKTFVKVINESSALHGKVGEVVRKGKALKNGNTTSIVRFTNPHESFNLRLTDSHLEIVQVAHKNIEEVSSKPHSSEPKRKVSDKDVVDSLRLNHSNDKIFSVYNETKDIQEVINRNLKECLSWIRVQGKAFCDYTITASVGIVFSGKVEERKMEILEDIS